MGQKLAAIGELNSFWPIKFKSPNPVAEAAVRSKAVVLLLLIRCLVCFPLVVGVLCLSLFCCTLLCVFVSFLVLQSS